jgi:hypothetical protein
MLMSNMTWASTNVVTHTHTHTYAIVTTRPFSIRTMGCISVRLVPIGIDALDTGTCGGATVLSPV